jgi:DNA polymerase sigma
LTIDEVTEQFFDLIDEQLNNLTKEIEKKLESVRKEREQVISIIEEIIKKTYNSHPTTNPKHYYQRHNFAGIRVYGSMASGLAIDSSDLDLAVIGLNFNGNRLKMVNEMSLLQE